jgi:methylenetetrahydrofolate--tRNA-(uracil-5-)-methyltransferase
LKKDDKVYFAGQITGVEGYIESAASGIAAGLNLALKLNSKEQISFPKETMLGALSKYISDESVTNFQPMGSNMGILPELPEKIKDKKLKYSAIAQRGIAELKRLLSDKEIV